MNRDRNLRRLQAGLSIVELMISLVLGLLLMAGIIQVFLSSRQTYAANEAMGRMQENGRFALDFIARSARMAGYIEPIYVGDKPLPVVPPDCSGVPATPPTGFCSSNGSTNTPDLIGFAMQPPVIDGARRNCLGDVIEEDDRLIINHFSIIAATPTTPASLGCRTSEYVPGTGWTTGGTPQALVEGIDNMQILYGISTSGDARSANQYVSADRVSNWSKVRSVRIAVLANSISILNPAPATRRFALLDAPPLTAADLGSDRRARQIFTTTVQLKNTD